MTRRNPAAGLQHVPSGKKKPREAHQAPRAITAAYYPQVKREAFRPPFSILYNPKYYLPDY